MCCEARFLHKKKKKKIQIILGKALKGPNRCPLVFPSCHGNALFIAMVLSPWFSQEGFQMYQVAFARRPEDHRGMINIFNCFSYQQH